MSFGYQILVVLARKSAFTFCWLLVTSLITFSANADATDYEEPSVFAAKDILGDELLSSEYHRVASEVLSDGYLNHYRIQSDYGQFDAQGLTMLRIRIREVRALAELDKVSKTKVFVDAAVSSGINQGTVIINMATRPVETIKGIPSGIARIFSMGTAVVSATGETVINVVAPEDDKNVTVEETAEEAQQLAEDLSGYSSIARRIAHDLGVDPYSTNSVLRSAIKAVAQVEFAAKTGVSIAVPTIPNMNYISGVNSMVWSTPPSELQEMNRAALIEMGMTENDADEFFSSQWYTPSSQTVIITALSKFVGVKNRYHVIKQATNAQSEDAAWFYVVSSMFFNWFHDNQSSIDRFIEGGNLPIAITNSGKIISMLPIDYLFWTETTANAADRLTDLANAVKGATSKEIWFEGKVSPLVLEELTIRGWVVHQNIKDQIDVILDF